MPRTSTCCNLRATCFIPIRLETIRHAQTTSKPKAVHVALRHTTADGHLGSARRHGECERDDGRYPTSKRPPSQPPQPVSTRLDDFAAVAKTGGALGGELHQPPNCVGLSTSNHVSIARLMSLEYRLHQLCPNQRRLLKSARRRFAGEGRSLLWISHAPTWSR